MVSPSLEVCAHIMIIVEIYEGMITHQGGGDVDDGVNSNGNCEEGETAARSGLENETRERLWDWVVGIDGNYPFSVTTVSGIITINPFRGNFFGNFA